MLGREEGLNIGNGLEKQNKITIEFHLQSTMGNGHVHKAGQWTFFILFTYNSLCQRNSFLYLCNSKEKPYQSMKSSEAPPPRPHKSSNLFRWILFKSFQLFPLFYILKKVLKICNRSTIQGRAKKDVWGAHEKLSIYILDLCIMKGPQLSAKKAPLFIFASVRCRNLQNV